MKKIFSKKILSVIIAAVITVTVAVMPVPVMSFDVPQADTGAVGDISNGGEWSIYSSKTGYTRTSTTGTAITDVTDRGAVEVTGSAGISAEFQFDLDTKTDNSVAVADKVIKSAELRLTPMVSKSNATQKLYTINNEFTTTEGKVPVSEFTVPRRNRDDFFADADLISLTGEELSEYPDVLSAWQTAIDVTGDVVGNDEKVSFLVEYSSGNTGKTEYATSNIMNNGRLNGGGVSLLYDRGITDYSKWVYPQIVLEYSDQAVYKNAYADFVQANSELSGAIVSEDSSITLSDAQNGSNIILEIYDTASSPIKVEGNSLIYNDNYAGSAESVLVQLTVTNTEGEETARYSRVISVQADYTKANTITFDTSNNPKGEISVTSNNVEYTDGTAYAKEGGVFYVNGGANAGYTTNVVVTKEGDETQVIAPNDDGSYTMPDSNVQVSVEYSKKTYGTSRIAAINSVSIKSDGSAQGNSVSAQNIVMGAGRITFLKFDLSGYNPDIITNAQTYFNAWNSANTKAVFYVPNNNWDENTISKHFCLDGTDDTNISGFQYTDENGDTTTASLLGGAGIVPDGSDVSTASEGILKDYYIGSSGTSTSDNFDVTDAIKKALRRSSDQIITLMIYSPGSGRDATSVMYGSLAFRPSLIIEESSVNLTDDEIVTEIKTIEDLETFAEIVNGGNSYGGKMVTLLNNLDLSDTYHENGKSWTAIGIPDIGGVKPFAGIFEGGSHSITGLYINGDDSNQGLFGTVTGTIQNLKVQGNIKGSSTIGGIAGWCSGNITNCQSSVNILAQREAGGIVGTLCGGGVISDCDNSGNIKIENKETYAGGIAAHNIDSVIENCSNTGKIENGTDGFRNKLGGIVGYLDNGEILDSHNTGEVVSNAEITSCIADETENYVGGIVGYSSYGIITNSSNSGAVHNAVDYSGGVAGFLLNGDTVSGCTNSGNVSGKGYVGGIVGLNDSSNVSDCRNDGAVSGTGEYIGGVIGYLAVGSLDNSSYDETLNSELKIVGNNSAGTVNESENPLPPVKFKIGDVNNDNKLSLDDALLALKIAVVNPSEEEKKLQPYLSADVNKDNDVTTEDVLMILQKVNGKEVPGVDWLK